MRSGTMLCTALLPIVCLLLAACSKQASESVAAPQQNGTPPLSEGEAIVKANCYVCHAQGINGAPIIGNAKMWRPRALQGEDILVQHASEGFGLMPARGGNEQLSEEELRLAIRYMLDRIP